MPKLSEVLSSPGLETLSVVTEVDARRNVSDIAMVRDSAELHKVPRDGVVILSSAMTDGVRGYQFDIWCRTAAERGAAALLVPDLTADDVPRTARRLADRSRLTVACVPGGTDMGRLVHAIARAIDAGAAETLSRATRIADVLTEAVGGAENGEIGTDELCELATRAGGRLVLPRRPAEAEVGAPVLVDGVEVDHVSAAGGSGPEGHLSRLAVRLTADAATQTAVTRQRVAELPIRSRTQLLSELLVAGPQHMAELVPRARSLGLAIDDWHVIVAIDTDVHELDEVERFGFAETLGAVAMQAVGRSAGGQGEGGGAGWHLAFAERAPLLVRTWKRNPGQQAGRLVRGAVETLYGELTRRLPEWRIRCGVGSVHESVEGLRASWAEARAALLSDDPGSGPAPPRIVFFDDLGLHRMLVEWYTTHTARTAVRDLLAPLEALGREKAETMVRTLRVYLDQQGSLSGTAAVLNLHRNAVSYRLKRITSLLSVDLNDPDQRLAVHLACRAWKMS
ncbi:sugar diacid utilization regulator [Spinactinospora alkalitolerans]|uniref:Sugar diacid utilization regulator n=1 Tax=Spinactinospora alkalitolerans TaxID=687207 RepID=A0A852TWB8_9ACTN|nr:helix-turn-helix domain-containing protein [Spinactinospora alkalitolerans]NYE48806.1 sugar diacid utilization regulator [Spinactinospora alkalitolerans]